MPVTGVTDVRAVDAGPGERLVLGVDGSVRTWGSSAHRSVAPATHHRGPIAIEALPRDAIAVAAGGRHGLVLLAEGTVMAFGDNSYGQLGDGSTSSSGRPLRVSGLTRVTAISAGPDHSLALQADGTVAAWGNGMDFTTVGQTGYRPQPSPAVLPDLDQRATAIAAGSSRSLAVLADGSVHEWGLGALGRIHFGASVHAIAVGAHGLAVLADGSVVAWGPNFLGQLGDGTRTDRTEPVTVRLPGRAVAVAGGYQHSVALLDDGAFSIGGIPSTSQRSSSAATRWPSVPAET